jgi:hypothetical protein
VVVVLSDTVIIVVVVVVFGVGQLTVGKEIVDPGTLIVIVVFEGIGG